MSKPYLRYKNLGIKTINVLILFSFTFAPLAPVFAQDAETPAAPSEATSEVTGQVDAPTVSEPVSTDTQDQISSMFEDMVGDMSDASSQSTQSTTDETVSEESLSDLPDDNQPQALLSGGDESPTTQAPNLFSYQNIKPQVDKNSGALTQKIALEIPPGRRGLQPEVSLTYNSQQLQDDSIVGYGWSVSIPYIERMNKRGTNNLYTDNYFYSSVSGELATTSATTTPNEYYARVDDGSHIQYLLSTSTNNSWIAYDKNGTKYTYGAASSTQQYDSSGDTTKVYRWMLQEVRDTNDNYITYTYTRDVNQLYPDTITYTGNGGTAGVMTVSFTLASSTVPYTTYKSAFKISTNKQVSRIEAAVNGTWVRRYDLTYGVGANGFRPLLTYIQQSGRDANGGEITLPPTGFSYASSTVGWTYSNGFGYPLGGQAYIATPTTDDGLNDQVLFRYDVSSNKQGDINGNYIGTVPEVWGSDGNPSIAIEEGTRFLDINADGASDLVRGLSKNGGNINTIYLNTSTTTGLYSGLYQVATSSIVGLVPYFARNEGGIMYTGGLLGNLNGDALPDYTSSQLDLGNNTSYVGNGQGWFQTSNFVPVKGMYNGFGSNAGFNSQMVDINGDGLDDWMWSDSSNTYFCINQGTAWDTGCISSWNLATSTLYYSGAKYFDRGMRFMDVNVDGLPDFIRAYNAPIIQPGNPGEQAVVYQLFLNTGSGWATSTVSSWGPAFTTTSQYGGIQGFSEMADWNGDGSPDAHQYPNQASKQDVLIKITYPKGGNTQITYKMTPEVASSTNPHLPTPMLVVTRLVTNDREGHDSQYDYTYTGGKLYLENGPIDRKFAGFSTITETGPLAVTKTYFNQGDVASTTIGERTDGYGQIGRAFREDVSSLTGTLLKQTFYQWDSTSLGNNRFLTVLGTQLARDFDASGANSKAHAIAYRYATSTGDLLETDDYGEVTASSDGTYTDTGSDTRVASSTYIQNSSINLSVPTATTQYMASTTRVKETRYTYDNLAFGSVTKGNLTKQEGWISGNTYATTTKGYNSYGLVASSSDPNGNQTTYSYDGYNLYPATVTNALSQATSYTYDYATGKVVQKTDPNTLANKNIYDAVGRLIEIDVPDLTTPSTLVPKTTISYTDNTYPSYTTVTNYLTSATSSTNYEYFDGLGRTLQTRTQASGINNYAVKDKVYGSAGLVVKESLPYFGAYAQFTNATSTGYLFVNYAYDALGRTNTVVNSVGTTTNVYGVWSNSKTDPNGNTAQYVNDAWGNLINVIEPLSATTATTTYTYDVVNNLTKITDALGNIRNFTYDGLGRVLKSEDLHAPSATLFGSTTYAYDKAGNVTSKINPNGQTTTFTYDALNRIYNENYTGGTGTEGVYRYDSCTRGIGHICTASTTLSKITYTYNSLGLVATENHLIASPLQVKSYVTAYTYDRQGNITDITYPDGNSVKYGLDAMGRIQSITNRAPGASVFSPIINNTEYAPTGQVSMRAYANGLYAQYIFDPTKIYRLSAIVTATTTSVMTVAYVTSTTTSSTTVASTVADVLVVGGGGGGGQVQAGTPAGGGGGGAGGLIIATSTLVSGNIYTVSVGNGGAANTNGGNSSALGLTAVGGGAGSSYNGSSFFAASSGGSGGGGMAQNNNGASGTAGQGNAGGNGGNSQGGGGGGGSGGGGANHNGSGGGGNGGSGTSSSISGTSVTYAGGGGGGARNGFGSGGAGGAPSAGNGGTNGSAGGSASNNSGSGGGGASAINGGGSGGSGIVIFSAPLGEVTASTTASHTTAGGKDIWTFTSDGAFSLNATTTYTTTYATSTYTITAASSSNPIQAISYTYDPVGNITSIYDVSSSASSKIAAFTYDELNRLVFASSTAYAPSSYVASSSLLNYLVVGGGGGGAGAGGSFTEQSGGGGGAQVNVGTTTIFTTGSYAVTVGARGTRGAAGENNGATGGTSVFASFATSTGGVGGTYGTSGGAGGSGGTSGSGNTGGAGANGGAGGGGGASTIGQDGNGGTSVGGNGGTGVVSSISGTSIMYGSGGGGGGYFTGGTGGSGGGAGGANAAGGGATANRGGGGGGGAKASGGSNVTGGHGGAGVVVVSYPVGALTATGGATSTSGGRMIHTFTTSGTFTISAVNSTTTIYSYPALYQTSYEYNSIGNITKKADAVDGSNVLYTYAGTNYANPHAPTSVASSTLTYDKDGNLTAYATSTYMWDWRDRMTRSVAGVGTTTYAYSTKNDRAFQSFVQQISTTTATTTTIYPSRLYSAATTTIGVGTTTISSSATSTDYIFAGDVLVATVERMSVNGAATGTPVTRYYYPDHLGSTNVVTDTAGTPVQTLDYYPYGATRLNVQVGGANANRQYIGQFTDPTNLSYLNARYYDGSRGQFLSQDPIFTGDPRRQNLENPQSLNSYSYANDNPIVNKDPSGKFVPQAVALGALFGGVSSVAIQGVGDYQSGQFSGFGNYGVAFARGAAVGAATVINPFLGAGVTTGTSLAGNYLQNGTLTTQDAVNAVGEGIVTGVTAGYLKGLPQVRGVQASDVFGSTYYTGAHAQQYAGEAAFDFATGLYYSGVKGVANTTLNSSVNNPRSTSVMSGMGASTPAYTTQTYSTPNGKTIDWYGNILSSPAGNNKK